ncbi:threonine synthase [Sulfuriroseicoccus oceanibius]|uniref:Threonine synthase n=1 Tax=Sulfuriroseicoccus oceanibius TaxID=2707525 RepID=A0A6B3L2P0_9BACT|nr:threonine synthase [Sulfuriroseicoccus oceanibius]QQL44343.1 threonine synthase [Sulfuriroseicoccus oceanibius]
MSQTSVPKILHDRGVISRYREFLPVSDATPVVSLNEGSTPLIHVPKLSALAGAQRQVFIKYEGLNPTCSFKDRGMTLAISKAAEEGAKMVICASTGNTSAAAAAYAVRAGMRCVVLLPAGKISMGKLAQAVVYGADVVAIDGNFDDALELVRELGQRDGIAVVNSINPFRIEGQKTASFEVIDELGDAPTVHCLPVGNAGNITAYWKGYREYHLAGKSSALPMVWGAQAEGAAPIVRGEVVTNPETVATAIRIGNPASWKGANEAIEQSGGMIRALSDDKLLEAQAWLAANEGIFVEPASAASVGCLLAAIDEGLVAKLPDTATVVCTVTGHGLKDIDTPMEFAGGGKILEAGASADSVLGVLGM